MPPEGEYSVDPRSVDSPYIALRDIAWHGMAWHDTYLHIEPLALFPRAQNIIQDIGLYKVLCSITDYPPASD